MNAINIIKPYKYLNMWVFDDPKVGLIQEPFVSGADIFLDKVTESIPNASDGFILIFSSSYFPDANFHLEWIKSAEVGNWYYSKEFNIEGWLCPALFKYFDNIPSNLYLKIQSL
ncbi:DUF6717 family protein [Orbus mooreae]|uniref:DUF6717 family protein n=1 Tax=Orbus mooreae TaxID=3074107 RepID=UPI00370D12F3